MTGSATVTFTATDDCGLVASVSANIVVTDNQAPVILNVGADETLDCQEPHTFSVPTVSDECGTFTLTENDETLGSVCDGYTITRTWEAVDECGNVSTASQTFTFICSCLLYTSPSPRDRTRSRMPSSA